MIAENSKDKHGGALQRCSTVHFVLWARKREGVNSENGPLSPSRYELRVQSLFEKLLVAFFFSFDPLNLKIMTSQVLGALSAATVVSLAWQNIQRSRSPSI